MSSPGVGISTFLYARTLRWYPPAMRTEFGEDMVALFAETVEASWQRSSWLGLARAWLAVARDVVEIVIPYRLACAIPAVLAVFCSVLLYGSALAAIDPNRHCFK